jgi:hypothetical protein
VAIDGDDPVADCEAGAFGQRRNGVLVREVGPFVQRLPCDRAIHRAGIDVAITEPRGYRTGDGALAGARRPVDRDDETIAAGAVRGIVERVVLRVAGV